MQNFFVALERTAQRKGELLHLNHGKAVSQRSRGGSKYQMVVADSMQALLEIEMEIEMKNGNRNRNRVPSGAMTKEWVVVKGGLTKMKAMIYTVHAGTVSGASSL